MSLTYAKAVREALPHAQLIVDRFHLVKKANEPLDEVRRRTTGRCDSLSGKGWASHDGRTEPVSGARTGRTGAHTH
jgi:transposase